METKHSLQELYSEVASKDQMRTLSHFFCHLALIHTATWEDVEEELIHLQGDDCEDFDRIRSIYTYLTSLNFSEPKILQKVQ